jgi:hypothetical protein
MIVSIGPSIPPISRSSTFFGLCFQIEKPIDTHEVYTMARDSNETREELTVELRIISVHSACLTVKLSPPDRALFQVPPKISIVVLGILITRRSLS